ncbi:Tn3 family transposase [Streptomyces sp. NBC_01361]|uniref:Tn3 family transposase n=1 Tax=Streptomyces sp. NBC_01361 TaxID=2903838 RepID=UPI002E2FAF36|nr:Tn3 family transposase [Streptomyces sp. NBC_01361]
MIRTIVLLRFLSEPELRESIQAMTHKVEAFHKFSNWLRFASDVLQDNDPVDQEKIIKFNDLLANYLLTDLPHRSGHHEGRQRPRRRGLGGRPGRPGGRHAVHHQQDPPLRVLAPGHGAARERGDGAAAGGRLTTTNRLIRGSGSIRIGNTGRAFSPEHLMTVLMKWKAVAGGR